jgi:hypothetical protein
MDKPAKSDGGVEETTVALGDTASLLCPPGNEYVRHRDGRDVSDLDDGCRAASSR